MSDILYINFDLNIIAILSLPAVLQTWDREELQSLVMNIFIILLSCFSNEYRGKRGGGVKGYEIIICPFPSLIHRDLKWE